MVPRTRPGAFEDVLCDALSHLGVEALLFLTLLDQLLKATDACHIGEIIIGIARLLKTLPAVLYQLNSLFYPYARVEFNIRRSPVTGFVLRISNTSRIVLLDSSLENPSLHNLTATRLCDILTNHTVGDRAYDDLYTVTDSALCDCLAQLAQDVLDGPISRTCRGEVLKFLRSCGGVPPSLLLYELEQSDVFCLTHFSDLYYGTLGTKRVVIKKPRILKDQIDRVAVLREVLLCRQFRHPNILPFLGISCDERDWLYSLVTPYMKYGNIIEFLRRYPNVNRLTPIWQVMKGLEFLHGFDSPIAHRDIKGANILVQDNRVCCLSDFGLSSMPELSQRSHEQAVGTAAWMAPEILVPPLRGRLDLLKADIFALGITILEIYTGRPPLPNKNWFAIYMERVVRKEKPSLPPACPHPFPSFLSEIVGMMLEYNPTERPSIRMICQGIEDVLSPPPRIEIEATDQQSLVESQATSTDDEFLRALAREFVRKERERIDRSMKQIQPSSNTMDPALPRNMTPPRQRGDSSSQVLRRDRQSALLRHATQRATVQSARVMSPPTDVEFSRGLPTPVTDVPHSPSPMIMISSNYREASCYTSPTKGTNTPDSFTPSDSSQTTSTVQHPRPRRLITSVERSTAAIPSQYAHCNSDDNPVSEPSLLSSKRDRLSSLGIDDRGEQESMPPSPTRKHCEEGVNSPSKRRRRHNHSLPSSPIATNSRTGEPGASVR